MSEPTDDLVSDATRAEESEEATERADAGRGPTPEEEEAAKRTKDSGQEVAEPYKEALERGANVKGEGEPSP